MASKAYVQVVTVEGAGDFPVDMLRYDQCFPKSEADTGVAFNPSRRLKRQVRVQRVVRFKGDEFTTARWWSFGWRVIPDTFKVEEL